VNRRLRLESAALQFIELQRRRIAVGDSRTSRIGDMESVVAHVTRRDPLQRPRNARIPQRLTKWNRNPR
jgi:hypothetical protein